MRLMLGLVLSVGITLPQPISPTARGLPSGYAINSHGCVVATLGPSAYARHLMREGKLPPKTPAPPTASRMTQLYGFTAYPGVYDSQVAHYYDDLGDKQRAVTFYRRALAKIGNENVSAGSIDVIRLRLSILLFRLHKVAEAKAHWRILVSRRSKFENIPDEGTREALRQRFHEALKQYALSPPPYNQVSFGESGAEYNLQRGLNAAARGDLTKGGQLLEYSLECSPFFQVPRLALGVIEAVKNDFTTARHEWLATLEGYDPAPDSGVTIAQYDAIYLLLKFD